jgi:hypothetical protein
MIGSHHLMKGFGLSYGRHSLVPYELFLMWRIHRTHNPRLDSGNRHEPNDCIAYQIVFVWCI